MIHALGWSASALVVLSLVTQVHKQWKAGTSKGVSRWMYVAQMVANVGFFIYAVLLAEPVFAVTSAALVVSAAVGLAIVWLHRRREERTSRSGALRHA